MTPPPMPPPMPASTTGGSGWVVFSVDGRSLAGPLDEVREVVRACGIASMSGTRAPVTGLLELRGTPVPVVDLRSVATADGGDVLVLTTGRGVLGLAVDRVVSVLGPTDLRTPLPAEPLPPGFPAYVVEVCRDARDRPVFVVSLAALAGVEV